MAGKSVSFSVEAKDKASSTLNNVSKNLNKISTEMKNSPIQKFGKSWDNLVKSASGFFFVTNAMKTVNQTIKKAVDTMKEYEKAWANVEATYSKIDFAARINEDLGSTSTEIKNWADNLAGNINSWFGSGDILSAMSNFLYDMPAEQIEKITAAAVDLAAATGTDLNTAVNTLAQTYNGTLSKALKSQFQDLNDLTTEELESGKAVELIAEKVKGAAQTMSQTTQGSIKANEDAVNSLKEELGYVFSENLTPMRNFFTEMAKKISGALAQTRQLEEAWNAYFTGQADVVQIQSLIDKTQAELDAAMNDAQKMEDNWFLDFISQMMSFGSYSEQVNGGGGSTATDNKITELRNVLEDLTKALEDKKAEVAENERLRLEKETAEKQAEEAKRIQDSINSWADALTSILPAINAKDYAVEQDYAVAMAKRSSMYQKAVDVWKAGGGDSAAALAYMKQMEANWQSQWDAAHTGNGTTETEETNYPANTYSVFSGFDSLILEASEVIEAGLGPLIEAFTSIDAVDALLNWQTTILNAMMDVLEPVITEVLTPLVGFLTILGNTLGQMLLPIIEAIGKVLELVYPVLIIVLDAVKAVTVTIANGITAVINGIIDLINLIPFVNVSKLAYTDYDFIDPTDTSSLTSAGTSTLSSYSSGSATYSGAKDIYITINYDHSYVNGDARDIALNLYNEFKLAEQLGYA